MFLCKNFWKNFACCGYRAVSVNSICWIFQVDVVRSYRFGYFIRLFDATCGYSMQIAVIQCSLRLFNATCSYLCIILFFDAFAVIQCNLWFFMHHSVILCNMRLFYAVCGSSMQLAILRGSSYTNYSNCSCMQKCVFEIWILICENSNLQKLTVFKARASIYTTKCI